METVRKCLLVLQKVGTDAGGRRWITSELRRRSELAGVALISHAAVFSLLFELSSSYGCIGLSMGNGIVSLGARLGEVGRPSSPAMLRVGLLRHLQSQADTSSHRTTQACQLRCVLALVSS